MYIIILLLLPLLLSLSTNYYELHSHSSQPLKTLFYIHIYSPTASYSLSQTHCLCLKNHNCENQSLNTHTHTYTPIFSLPFITTWCLRQQLQLIPSQSASPIQNTDGCILSLLGHLTSIALPAHSLCCFLTGGQTAQASPGPSAAGTTPCPASTPC